MRLSRTFAATLLSLVFVAAPVVSTVSASDDDTPPAWEQQKQTNVLVKITLGKIENGRQQPLRSYHLLAPGTGAPARINTAKRIPIPSVSMPGDDSHGAPVTAFSYQNVGFQANVRATMLKGGEVRVSAEIEDAALYDPSDLDRKSGPTKAPVLTNFSQTIEAVVHGGAPLTTTVVDDPAGQSMYIQVGAEIQR